MLDIGIRFVIDSGNVDFFTEELNTIELGYKRDNDLQINQTTNPNLVNKGERWNTLVIQFVEYYSTTRAKIESLINEKDEMTCYYLYHKYLTDRSLNCIYVPNERKRIWLFGERGARILHVLEFWES